MKTLVFDLCLQLRGSTELEDQRAALMELANVGLIEATSGAVNPEHWNFVRVEDEVADELVSWQALGEPLGVSPLIDMAAWRRWKKDALNG